MARKPTGRDAYLSVRLSPALKQSIMARAAAVGVGEISTYLMGLVARDMRENDFPLGPVERMELAFALLETVQADIRDGWNPPPPPGKKKPRHSTRSETA